MDGASERPNVLLVCVDHWPGKLLGAAGHEFVQTPTLDQLCANGIHFTQAYSECPTCIPARRAMMTGLKAQSHGDRVFSGEMLMPEVPTLAQTFRDNGYQAYAVGKLHVYPQRDRIGFDDVILNEEGRHFSGEKRDDYELFLRREGFGGQEFAHGMSNNLYETRPWHLPEYAHPTNWAVREMCNVIDRRDPTRPAFWYLSFVGPHPPLAPLNDYLDMYRDIGVDMPFMGEWAEDDESLPYFIRQFKNQRGEYSEVETRMARRAFYAMCTHIDHQLRLVIGKLSEEGLLQNTIVMFTCDHGDMLGNHGMWAKPPMFEGSAKIPMLLMPQASAYERLGFGVKDERLAELRDVMPTLLDLCDLPIPEHVEGNSLVGDKKRDHLYCEHYEGAMAVRMVRHDKYKLIWYPAGNRFQLFDLDADPDELKDIYDNECCGGTIKAMKKMLLDNLWGNDHEWIQNGELVGMDAPEPKPFPNRGMSGQRGLR
jgi:arylsulfatase A-like enzyme